MKTSRQRTLLLITPYFWPAIGGLEHYAQTIAQGLSRRGWHVHIVTSGTQSETITHQGLTIQRLKTSFTFFNTPVGLHWRRDIKRIISEIKPDIINLHAPVPSMALAGWWAAGRTPIVLTYHAGSMRKGRLAADVPIWLFEHLLLPQLLRRVQHIVASSEFVKQSFFSNWAQKTSVITPGVDSQRFASTPNHQTQTPFKLVFVGDARDPRKGLGVLLQSMAQLPDCHLHVIGHALNVMTPNVTYHGPLTGQDLVQAYQSADAVILPSTTNAESFGMTLLEAMSCGRPVIGSNVGGIPTLLQDGTNGLLVAPGDADALAKTIRRLIQDPSLARKLGRTGRSLALNQYDWDSRIAQTAAILEANCHD